MKTITITLEVSEMLLDIRNKAYLTGRTREAEDTKAYESASNMQASEDSEDMEQLLRSISTHFAVLKRELAECLDLKGTSASNGIIESTNSLSLGLNMPSNFNLSVVDSIAQNSHAYIVSMSLADWFAITSKSDQQIYLQQAAMNLDNLKRAVRKRQRPQREEKQ